jgi:hypothetical protein
MRRIFAQNRRATLWNSPAVTACRRGRPRSWPKRGSFWPAQPIDFSRSAALHALTKAERMRHANRHRRARAAPPHRTSSNVVMLAVSFVHQSVSYFNEPNDGFLQTSYCRRRRRGLTAGAVCNAMQYLSIPKVHLGVILAAISESSPWRLHHSLAAPQARRCSIRQ